MMPLIPETQSSEHFFVTTLWPLVQDLHREGWQGDILPWPVFSVLEMVVCRPSYFLL